MTELHLYIDCIGRNEKGCGKVAIDDDFVS